MHKEQIHANGSVRHAEKRRTGTCEFANRIARISLEAFRSSVPQSYRDVHKQTCVAAIVAHFKDTDIDKEGGESGSSRIAATAGIVEEKGMGQLQVMGLGVGTKFLSDDVLRKEQRNCQQGINSRDHDDMAVVDGNEESDGERNKNYGTRVRDCHAEVLARRAFRRQIVLELLDDLRYNSKMNKAEKKDEDKMTYRPIFERVDTTIANDASDETNRCHNTRSRYRLRPNVTLHFYASSAPCGNATLKKFTKMEKEIFDTSLGPDEWPQQIHKPIAAHSLRLGQFAILVKRDTTCSSSQSTYSPPLFSTISLQSEYKNQYHCNQTNKISTSEQTTTKHNLDTSDETQQQQCNNREKKKKSKTWPCNENDSWCPPSCSITNFNRGTIHSCSDKLCRWNCLGLQGSLLMAVLEAPLYMTTLTVGRKFSRAICQRAVCCRAEGFRSRREGESDNDGVDCDGQFRVNHPVLMETSVYLDETGVHKMEGIKSIGKDANFESTYCWVWWPGKNPKCGYLADCVDGKTGFLIRYEDDIDDSADEKRLNQSTEICTLSLYQSTIEIIQNCGNTDETTRRKCRTLADMRSLKEQISRQYEDAKCDLFRHRVFRQWSCRYCRDKAKE